jgi:hypothetical protein
MATFVQKGAPYEVHIGFSAIGEWAELNNYAFVGPLHGVVIGLGDFQNDDELIVEAQFPIQKRDAPFNLLDSGS